jgi:hypothetical protein
LVNKGAVKDWEPLSLKLGFFLYLILCQRKPQPAGAGNIKALSKAFPQNEVKTIFRLMGACIQNRERESTY